MVILDLRISLFQIPLLILSIGEDIQLCDYIFKVIRWKFQHMGSFGQMFKRKLSFSLLLQRGWEQAVSWGPWNNVAIQGWMLCFSLNSFIPGGVASSWTGCHVSVAKSFLFSQKPQGFTVTEITEADLGRWELYIPLVKPGPCWPEQRKIPSNVFESVPT